MRLNNRKNSELIARRVPLPIGESRDSKYCPECRSNELFATLQNAFRVDERDPVIICDRCKNTW